MPGLMFSSALPRVYEHWWRPAWGWLLKGGAGMGEELRLARLLLDLHPGDGVLDVACGTGAFTRAFAERVGDEGLAVGLDASPTMLRRAVGEGLLAQLAYVRGDAAALPFRARSFDAVCCFAALNLMGDPFAALDEAVRVLTPGGRLALFTSCAPPFPLGPASRAVGTAGGMRIFGRDELTGALRERGLVDVHQKIAGLTQFVGARVPR